VQSLSLCLCLVAGSTAAPNPTPAASHLRSATLAQVRTTVQAAEVPHPEPTPEDSVLNTYEPSLHVDFPQQLLHDNQVGRRGFLRVGSSGHFTWADGSRARFWGINVSNRSLWITHDEIDRVVQTLDSSHVNLVRFEALDSRGGLLEVPGVAGSRRLSPEKLETLQYWIYQLHRHRIYYYLDLLDFRDFSEADGVLNARALGRAAKPYAVFDPYLIELQKEYATQLLTAVNPYTRLAPVQDPLLVLVEICNEHGFFLQSGSLDSLADPYRSELRSQWCAWLRKHYGSRESLARAWGRHLGTPVLAAHEDPVSGTMALPLLHSQSKTFDLRFSRVRLRDGVRFLHDTQRAYFKALRDHLRHIGLIVPVTATVSSDIAPDLASVALECDFVAENHYADHPRFSQRDWEGYPHFFNRNQLKDGSVNGFAPQTAALRWSGKPVVVREWGTVWPNTYRCASVPEAAAYASMQDLDAVLLFAYKTRPEPGSLIEFGYQADPPVWGLYTLGALMFLRGDILPSPLSATLVYDASTLFRGASGAGDLLRLAWCLRLDSAFDADAAPKSKPSSKHFPLTVPVRDTDPQRLLETLAHGLWKGLEGQVYTSATGQVRRDVEHGRLMVHSPKSCLIAGELPVGLPVTVGPVTLTSASPVGALIAISLDERPLTSSRHFVIKMVTVAENIGQKLVPSPTGSVAPYVLLDRGTGPVSTQGAPSATSTEISVAGERIARVNLVNGTFEVLVDGRSASFWCDTPGISAQVLDRAIVSNQASPTLR
jgi:Beta-galactosidase